ncbi:glycosyltransferase family 4 protein [Gracilimonas sp. Q87]|uniref:glycosyltransferase family 4 protein n=1 Tax=Gracilimonas sp. Q87 TaxID=3384766 RepID=UPI0039845870
MKVAIIEPVGGHGGMDYYDYGLSYGLGQNDCDVDYYTCSKTKKRHYKNVTTKLSFGEIWTKGKLGKGFKFFYGYILSFLSAKLRKKDLVHLHFFDLSFLNVSVLFLAKIIFQHTVVITFHDVNSFKSSATGLNLKKVFAWMDKIIVHNEFSKKELLSKGVEVHKVEIIPHGNYLLFVNELDYTNIEDDNNLELLFFGQIKEVKGLDLLLEAMVKVTQKTHQVHLTIAGRPWHDDPSVYNTIIEKHKLENFVTTEYRFIPDEEVEDYFKKADLVVLPYKRIYQSGVLLLSMSYGRPVLSSNLPAFTEIIEEGETGFIFESENTQSLIDKILKLEKRKEDLIKVRNKASKKIKTDFDWVEIGRKTKKLYSSINY